MLYKILPTLLISLTVGSVMAQNDNQKNDTTEVVMTVVKEKKFDSTMKNTGHECEGSKHKRGNIITSFWGFDIGFSNYADNTNYGSSAAQTYAPGSDANYFDLRNGKSINVNIWLMTQKINLIKHAVNFKYALGIESNNYRYKSNIRYTDAPISGQVVTMDVTPDRTYKKNKLVANYFALPMMINFNFLPEKYSYRVITTSTGKRRIKETGISDGYGFSAGVSVGYLFSSRNKFVTSDEGKKKINDDFDLRPIKISYVGELNLGEFSIYGSYAAKSMYKKGLDITPYTIGLRLMSLDFSRK
jgi:hypothetical protein